MAKVWKIAPGEKAMFWDRCRRTGCIALGWGQLGDYRKYKNAKQIVRVLGGGPGDGQGAARSILTFTYKVEIGDVVIANDGKSRIVGIGVIESDYIPPNAPKNPSNEDWFQNIRFVDWIVKESIEFAKPIFNIPTVHKVTAQKVEMIRKAYAKVHPLLRKKLDDIFLDVEFGTETSGQTMKKINTIEQTLVEKEVFNPKGIKDARERVLTSIVQRRGQPTFRAKLLKAYGGKCAISGCDVIEVLEAAHIREYLGPKTNNAANGLLLRADLHTLFDLHLISVDEKTMKVVVSPKLEGTVYDKLAGKKIKVPKDASCQPNLTVLAKHRKACRL